MDIAPDLIKNILEAYEEFRANDKQLAGYLEKVAAGKADYLTGNNIAIRLGNDLAKAFKMRLSSADLPDGTMYYNIAKRLINECTDPSLTEIAKACEEIQQTLNTAAGIGMKPVVPDKNRDRLDGLIERLSSGEQYDDIAWILDEPIINLHQSYVDDFIHDNCESQFNAGLSPKIVRTAVGNCCKWCKGIAGTYDYASVKNTGNDVFRRHERCRCNVEYIAGKTKQNVWTKMTAESRPYQEQKPKTDTKKGMLDRLSALSNNDQNSIVENILNGDVDTTLRYQKYMQHVEGTPQYNNATRDRGKPQSILTISQEEAQKLIYQYAGAGTQDKTTDHREYVSVNKIIGVYHKDGNPIKTDRVGIEYSKKGTHLYPVREL